MGDHCGCLKGDHKGRPYNAVWEELTVLWQEALLRMWWSWSWSWGS
jgi:hypothetical protein